MLLFQNYWSAKVVFIYITIFIVIACVIMYKHSYILYTYTIFKYNVCTYLVISTKCSHRVYMYICTRLTHMWNINMESSFCRWPSR